MEARRRRKPPHQRGPSDRTVLATRLRTPRGPDSSRRPQGPQGTRTSSHGAICCWIGAGSSRARSTRSAPMAPSPPSTPAIRVFSSPRPGSRGGVGSGPASRGGGERPGTR